MKTASHPSPASLHLDQPMQAADDVYEALLEAHQGLSFEQSTDLNARLVLILAHQVGNIQALRACLAAARL